MLGTERSLKRQKETGFGAYLGTATSSLAWREGGDEGGNGDEMENQWRPYRRLNLILFFSCKVKVKGKIIF